MDSFIVISLIKIFVVFGALMTILAYLQWVERKVIAHIQVRPGPYRVGPHGLLQPLADVIKLITKEDLVPPYVNKVLYLAAPFFAITMALLSISVIPFGAEIHIFGDSTWMQLTDLNIGILFVLAVSSVSVYGIALAGWASNNKYSLMGGLRSSAQMISYELPLSMAVAAPLLLVNSLSLRHIVEQQAGYYLGFIPRWSIFQTPMPQVFSFIIFGISTAAGNGGSIIGRSFRVRSMFSGLAPHARTGQGGGCPRISPVTYFFALASQRQRPKPDSSTFRACASSAGRSI